MRLAGILFVFANLLRKTDASSTHCSGLECEEDPSKIKAMFALLEGQPCNLGPGKRSARTESLFSPPSAAQWLSADNRLHAARGPAQRRCSAPFRWAGRYRPRAP